MAQFEEIDTKGAIERSEKRRKDFIEFMNIETTHELVSMFDEYYFDLYGEEEGFKDDIEGFKKFLFANIRKYVDSLAKEEPQTNEEFDMCIDLEEKYHAILYYDRIDGYISNARIKRISEAKLDANGKVVEIVEHPIESKKL